MNSGPGSEGGCRCGKVRFKVSGRPIMTTACHCTGCQRMTASAFSLTAMYPSANFAVTAGEPVIGGLHGGTRHFFCPYCMSWLFTRPEGMDELVNVRATMFDSVDGYRPFVESYTSEMLPWASTGAKHSFAKFPSPDQFPALLAEFARSAPST